MENNEFFIRCAGGFEPLLKQELLEMGCSKVRPLTGGLVFFGSLEQAYRVCLWSRVAARVFIVLDRFEARDAEQLYKKVFSMQWENHIGLGASIAVNTRGVNDELRNTQFTSLKVKDAICDMLREKRGVRPEVQTYRPGVLVDVSLRKSKATISIDLSGESLHRRGYRESGKQSAAPLKENLAAALVLESGWRFPRKQDDCFIDPLCGSGTLALEAALIAADGAPGIARDYWGFQGWLPHDPQVWDSLLDEADERFSRGLETMPTIIASDKDPQCIELARRNAKRAGLANAIQFSCADVSNLSSHVPEQLSSGIILTNPPYGERLSNTQEIKELYASLAQAIEGLQGNWSLSLVTPDDSLDTALGMKPCSTKEFYNGRIEVTLRRYLLGKEHANSLDVIPYGQSHARTVRVSEANSSHFLARLKKNVKNRRVWARRENVSCYRVYDADLPDYAVAIDYYAGAGISAGAEFLVIAEYAAPHEIDGERARRRLNDVLALTPVLFDVSSDKVFLKTRKKGKGGSQYKEEDRDSFRVQVDESGHLFELDFTSYLDTGLFLDHRETRKLITELAAGTHFLNLFAYTGTATVYAAAGGAVETTTVDLSQTYLNWAERNMALNSFTGPQHSFIRADVLPWLDREARRGESYDFVFVDPPTFSNSKLMGKRNWSVKRDYLSLLQKVARILKPNGKVLFSCNLRNFKPDYLALEKVGIVLEDISSQTIPEDFKRNPKIHHCYMMSLSAQSRAQ